MLVAYAVEFHDAVAADLATAQGALAATMDVAGVTVDTEDVAAWVTELATCISDAQEAGIENVNTLHCATGLTSVQRKAIKAVNYAAAHP